MSFSYDAKFEVIDSAIPEDDCCCFAELSAIIRTCGSITKDFAVSLSSELPNLCKRVDLILHKLYPNAAKLKNKTEERVNLNKRYIIEFPKDISKDLLIKCHILKENYNGEMDISNNISRSLIEKECCRREFIKGAFIGCASANIVIKDINDLKKHTGGYHLEFVFANASLAGDFVHLLSQFGIFSKIMQRKKLSVVYLKEAEVVSDMLAFVGANHAVLTLQNEFAVREVRNQLNRQLNCMNSNMEKMVDASLKQIDAIEYISKTIGLESLPDNLYELCMLRIANPEETMENLAKLMTVPLTKSGVNHRLRKIVKIADEIKKKND